MSRELRDFHSWEAGLDEKVGPSLPFTLVGYRHLGTGAIRSARHNTHPAVGWEPVFTGGPEMIAPLLETMIRFADDRTQGVERRARKYLDHRFDAQGALAEFVDRGGQIP